MLYQSLCTIYLLLSLRAQIILVKMHAGMMRDSEGEIENLSLRFNLIPLCSYTVSFFLFQNVAQLPLSAHQRRSTHAPEPLAHR